jgi:hypothetical protein
MRLVIYALLVVALASAPLLPKVSIGMLLVLMPLAPFALFITYAVTLAKQLLHGEVR